MTKDKQARQVHIDNGYNLFMLGPVHYLSPNTDCNILEYGIMLVRMHWLPLQGLLSRSFGPNMPCLQIKETALSLFGTLTSDNDSYHNLAKVQSLLKLEEKKASSDGTSYMKTLLNLPSQAKAQTRR
jgi:hypothetical protein